MATLENHADAKYIYDKVNAVNAKEEVINEVSQESEDIEDNEVNSPKLITDVTGTSKACPIRH